MPSLPAPAEDREPLALEISQLRVTYGPVVAVDGLDLVARAGEVVALLGPNGAGKTSTLEAAEGYRRPAGGHVRCLGYDPVRQKRQLSTGIGVMLQTGGVYPGMGPLEALRLFASYYSGPEDPWALLARARLQKVAKTPWKRLSGGEQQRLSLALAVVGRPRLAFLDEPTSGVDPEGRDVVREIVSELRDRGACVVLTTHELEEAQKVADRVVIVDRGQVVAQGTVAELAQAAGAPQVRWRSRPGVATTELAAALGGPVVEGSPGSYRATTSEGAAAVATIAGWLADHDLPMEDVRTGPPPLEELYRQLVGQPVTGQPVTGQP
jgi:ABC-2 type transport system ATP-binding protein